MGKIIKVVLSAVVVAMSFNFVACDKGTISNKVSSILNLKSDNSIIFDDTEVSKDEVMSYESAYKDACATYYKDKLSEEELQLYNTFIYAYEHKYKNIKFNSSNSNLGDSYKKIVQCLSAENPFIDWNQQYSYVYSSGCYEFTSTQLDRKDVDLKIQAYNKAKEILKSMPQGSAYDKVLWIYSYIVNNITYVEDSNSYLSGSPSFIYDGLIGGKTQCTGFADTMTMMCNLAGIQTITICGETNEGHAWNLVNLDGNFYYCDATSDSVIKADLPEGIKDLHLSFLKSEEVFSANGYSSMSDVVIDFPKASDKRYDSNNVDFNLENLNNENDLISMAQKLMNGKSYVVVHLKEVSVDDASESTAAANYILSYISNNMTSSVYKYVTVQNLISEGSNDVVFFVNFEK